MEKNPAHKQRYSIIGKNISSLSLLLVISSMQIPLGIPRKVQLRRGGEGLASSLKSRFNRNKMSDIYSECSAQTPEVSPRHASTVPMAANGRKILLFVGFFQWSQMKHQ